MSRYIASRARNEFARGKVELGDGASLGVQRSTVGGQRQRAFEFFVRAVVIQHADDRDGLDTQRFSYASFGERKDDWNVFFSSVRDYLSDTVVEAAFAFNLLDVRRDDDNLARPRVHAFRDFA